MRDKIPVGAGYQIGQNGNGGSSKELAGGGVKVGRQVAFGTAGGASGPDSGFGFGAGTNHTFGFGGSGSSPFGSSTGGNLASGTMVKSPGFFGGNGIGGGGAVSDGYVMNRLLVPLAEFCSSVSQR